jgi:hypothetical protein
MAGLEFLRHVILPKRRPTCDFAANDARAQDLGDAFDGAGMLVFQAYL